MQVTGQEQVTSTASAISRYLTSRPNACDTVEGIAKWWLVRQRYEDSLVTVQRALDYLESSGEIVKISVAGSKVMYRKVLRK